MNLFTTSSFVKVGIDMDVVAASELAFSGNGAVWLLMGMACLAVMYLTVRPRKNKKDPLAYTSPMRSSLAQQKALERDMQNVIVELSELTRQMSAQLETRATKLELLIQDADERLAALNDAQAKAPPAAATSDVAEPVRPMRLVKDEPSSEDRWNEVYRLADTGATIGEICRQLNRPRGEVELILALRPKPRTDSTEPAAAVG